MSRISLLLPGIILLGLIVALPSIFAKDDQYITYGQEVVSIQDTPDQDFYATSTLEKEIPNSVILDVPLIMQKYSLSCEVASLQMVLAYKGVVTDQDKLIAEMKFSEPRIKHLDSSGVVIWGDPDYGFVGDIKGFMYGYSRGTASATGWGINNRPVAELARLFYPNSFAYQGKGVDDLIDELIQGNPVIVWRHSGLAEHLTTLTRYETPSGKIINFVPTHVSVVGGFVRGDDGKYIFMINDPEYGRLEIGQDDFDKGWSRYHRDMVVLR